MNGVALARIADAAGIERSYMDVWGRTQEVSDATLQAVLEAMHTPSARTGNSEDKERTASAERSHIEPIVIRQSVLADGVRIDVPSYWPGHVLTWRLTEESGAIRSGSADPQRYGDIQTGQPREENCTRQVRIALPLTTPVGSHELGILDGI